MNEDLVNDDFIFLDPPHPYRSKAFSEFPFTMQDHERLADWLIDNCKCQWLLLLKPSRVIESLYWKGKSRGIHFNYFTKGFRIRKNFMDYETKHVLIKNY
jgi:DNA adenine methylase